MLRTWVTLAERAADAHASGLEVETVQRCRRLLDTAKGEFAEMALQDLEVVQAVGYRAADPMPLDRP